MTNFNNKWLSFLTIGLLVANIVTLTMLWMGNKKNAGNIPAGPAEQPYEFVEKELALTQQQQQQYRLLREQHQQQQRPLADSMVEARTVFFDLLKNSPANDSLVLEFNKKVAGFQQQLELVNFKHFQQLRAICNVDQQKKFDAILQQLLGRIAGPRGPRNGPPPPGGREGAPPPAGNDH